TPVPFSFLCILVVPRCLLRAGGGGGGGGGAAWGTFPVAPLAIRTMVPHASHRTVEPPERSVTSILSWQPGHFRILAIPDPLTYGACPPGSSRCSPCPSSGTSSKSRRTPRSRFP